MRILSLECKMFVHIHNGSLTKPGLFDCSHVKPTFQSYHAPIYFTHIVSFTSYKSRSQSSIWAMTFQFVLACLCLCCTAVLCFFCIFSLLFFNRLLQTLVTTVPTINGRCQTRRFKQWNSRSWVLIINKIDQLRFGQYVSCFFFFFCWLFSRSKYNFQHKNADYPI